MFSFVEVIENMDILKTRGLEIHGQIEVLFESKDEPNLKHFSTSNIKKGALKNPIINKVKMGVSNPPILEIKSKEDYSQMINSERKLFSSVFTMRENSVYMTMSIFSPLNHISNINFDARIEKVLVILRGLASSDTLGTPRTPE